MSVFDGLPDIFVGAFGKPVTINKGAGDVQVNGIFNPRSVDAFGVSQPEAMLHLRAVDAQGLSDGHTATVDGQLYYCRVLEPDGKGMVPIRLEVANG